MPDIMLGVVLNATEELGSVFKYTQLPKYNGPASYLDFSWIYIATAIIFDEHWKEPDVRVRRRKSNCPFAGSHVSKSSP